MHITDYSIKNPVKVTVAVILLCLFGLLAFVYIPVQLTPEVVQPVVSVRTRWVGASPSEIESEIVSRQEEQLQDVEGLIDFRSECTYGQGMIEMTFATGTDINSTLLLVNNRLSQVRGYPEDTDEPVIRTVGINSSSIAYLNLLPAPPTKAQLRAFLEKHPELSEPFAPLLAAETVDVPTVYRLARDYPAAETLILNDADVFGLRKFAEDYIAAPIKKVPGVGDCDIYGGSQKELRIIVDPVKLAALQITISQLRDSLTTENSNISAGDMWEGKSRILIRTVGQYRLPEQVASTIVTYRDNSPIYVRDIAQVELTNSKSLGRAHQRGVPMLTAAVQRKEGANVLKVMSGVREKVHELNEGVLASQGLWLMQSYDETVYIDSAIALVKSNVVVGGILAVAVLLLFLRDVRSTLIVGLAIPICAIGTFLIIYAGGRSINVISLAGMAFAVGMVVDSAIVVLENIFTHYQKGDSPPVAASRGTKEVWGAVMASTLTTVAVFLPVIFIQEEAGQLFRDIAIAIVAGVSLSVIVSLTVIPTAASRLLRYRDEHRGAAPDKPTAARRIIARLDRRGQRVRAGIVWLTRRVQAGQISRVSRCLLVALFAAGAFGLVPVHSQLDEQGVTIEQVSQLGIAIAVVASLCFVPLVFRAPRVGLVSATIVATAGFSLWMMPDAEYLPEGNKNLITAMLLPPPGYNIDHLEQLGRVVENRLEPYWEATPGSPEAAALDGPTIDNFFLVARGSSVFMGGRTYDESEARALIPVMERAVKDIPGVNSFVSQSSLFAKNMSGGRVVDVEITGPNLEELVRLGGIVMSQVREMYPQPTLTNIRAIPSLEMGSTELHIRRNPEKAATRGVTTNELGYTIDALNDGAFAGSYWHQDKEIDLVIYGSEEFAQRTQDIATLPVGTPTGELVTVGDVADVLLTAGPEQILRIDREKAITIQVQPGPDISLEEAMTRIDREVLQPLANQPGVSGGGYQFRLAGTADDLKQMRSVVGTRLLLSVFITFLLIAALYESFLYPIVIMVSVPLAAVGGIAGLQLLNLFVPQRLDILTMLGFVILVGTVVNNAILIVERTLQLIREDGLDHRAAITRSVRGRVRPILMTTATTVLGMFPLVVLGGAGSELYRGLGSVVLGGLIVSTLFTLFLVPTLFSLLYEARLKLLGPERPVADLLAEAQTPRRSQAAPAQTDTPDDGPLPIAT